MPRALHFPKAQHGKRHSSNKFPPGQNPRIASPNEAAGRNWDAKRLFLPPCTAHSFSARRKRMGGAFLRRNAAFPRQSRATQPAGGYSLCPEWGKSAPTNVPGLHKHRISPRPPRAGNRLTRRWSAFPRQAAASAPVRRTPEPCGRSKYAPHSHGQPVPLRQSAAHSHAPHIP
jgi:hypothetical protein